MNEWMNHERPPPPSASSTSPATALAQQRGLLPCLFELMQTSILVDGAVSLAQELLAAGPDLFVLSDVSDSVPQQQQHKIDARIDRFVFCLSRPLLCVTAELVVYLTTYLTFLTF